MLSRGWSAPGHLVHAHSDGQDQGDVLVLSELDPVGVPDAEPLLGDLCDLVAVALDLVLVVEDVAMGLQVLAALDVDDVVVADADESLVDSGGRGAMLDRHLVAGAELLLLDLGDLIAAGGLEGEGVAEAHGLAVDLVGLVALFVLDPVVVPDGEQLLPHPERRSVEPVASQSHGLSLPTMNAGPMARSSNGDPSPAKERQLCPDTSA